ncbi:TNF receptor-associated factor 6-like [Oculina patagonica]
MPGYKVPFVQKHSVHICVSCGLLLRDAIQTFCGHHYCATCIGDIFAHKQCLRSVKCLHRSCNEPLEQHLCFADKQIRKEVLDIITPCLYKDSGCVWIGQLRFAENHYKECRHQPVACRNVGCNMHVPQNTLAYHQEEECPFRLVVCNSCNLSVKVADHASHCRTCDNHIIACPNCGRENIQLCELKKHQHPIDGDCPQKQCPFQEYGCVSAQEKMSHDQLSTHLEESQLSHNLMFMLISQKTADNNQLHLENLDTQLDALKQSFNTAETQIADHDWALKNLYEMYMHLAEEIKKKR